MPKSCFDGYLTPECAKCPDWHDGTGDSIGCATTQPIMLCPYFKKMFLADEAKRKQMIQNGLHQNDE